ncbi:MAG TPA: pilus assembly protein PilM [Tepidisphaeraceae bacterium]|nr:pilus assembly protein PilM [Tepidisphaeraceae bacterium]
MLSFVQNLFATRVNPIGVDFGTDCLRMAQVQEVNNDHKLVAAACCDVPSHVRSNPQARMEFFTEALRDLLSQGRFRGRQAVLALPASSMIIQHVRLAKMGEDETRTALPFELRGKLPFDPSHAIIRHLVAGEVFVEQEQRQEVIAMAAARETVNQLLAAAARAKLDVVGMNVEPKAVIDCFSHVYRRKTDAEAVTCFVDLGASGTRAVIAQGTQILFARSIEFGGDHLTRRLADAMSISFEDAKLQRLQLAAQTPVVEDRSDRSETSAPPTRPADEESPDNSFALLGAALAKHQRSADPEPSGVKPASLARPVDQLCHDAALKLVDELNFCRRYYESVFPSKPLQKLIFVGGDARQRTLCQTIAREMRLAAQMGDPMVRMAKDTEVGIESGIDRRQPQPGWAVSLGLSMGPKHATVESTK